MGRFIHSQPSSSNSASCPAGYLDDYKSIDKPTSRYAKSGISAVCNYGLVPVTQTSTTDLNPGRVFTDARTIRGHHVYKWWDDALIEEIHDLRYVVSKQSSILETLGKDDDDEAKLSDKLCLIQSSIEILKESMVERLDGANYWRNTFVSVDLKHVVVGVIFIGLINSYLWLKSY